VGCAAFSSDGRLALTGSQSRQAPALCLWNVQAVDARKQVVSTFRDQEAEVTAVAFAPDGQWVLSGDVNGRVRLWDLRSTKSPRDFKGYTDTIASVAFSPNGQYIAACSSQEKVVRVWDRATGGLLRRDTAHQESVLAVTFSDDRHVLSVGKDGVRRWFLREPETGPP
jgi:WD40 repeat protein